MTRYAYAGQCGQKRRYATEREADAALVRIQQHGYTVVRPKAYYRCNFCHGWHLTSHPKT